VFTTEMPLLKADFNNVEDDDSLVIYRPTSFNARSRGMRRGKVVTVWDPRSGYCPARVKNVRRRRIEVSLDWDNWSPIPAIDNSLVFSMQDPPVVALPRPAFGFAIP